MAHNKMYYFCKIIYNKDNLSNEMRNVVNKYFLYE